MVDLPWHNKGIGGHNDGGNDGLHENDDDVESQHDFNIFDKPNDGICPLRDLLAPGRTAAPSCINNPTSPRYFSF